MAAERLDVLDEEDPPRRGCGWVVLLLLLGALGTAAYFWYEADRKTRAEAAVTAAAGRLTLGPDSAADVREVARQGNPELWYRVDLDNAPVGRTLALECAWVDPAGRVAHRNRYETREITRTPWPTHARHTLGPDAPPGRWTVRLALGGRELHTLMFQVIDGQPGAGGRP